jgi:hypothetical protein
MRVCSRMRLTNPASSSVKYSEDMTSPVSGCMMKAPLYTITGSFRPSATTDADSRDLAVA